MTFVFAPKLIQHGTSSVGREFLSPRAGHFGRGRGAKRELIGHK